MAEDFREDQEQETQQNEVPETSQKMSFQETVASLPHPLMTQVLKRFSTAATTALVVTIAWIMLKDWHYAIGYAIALFAAYVGMDIIWKYGDGKILQSRMVICKATKGLKNQVHIILRDAAATDLLKADIETYSFSLEIPARKRSMISPGTVMDIYISESSPNTILAYEILGEVSI